VVAAGARQRRVACWDEETDPQLRLTDLGKANLLGWRQANQERVTAALERLTESERQSITNALSALAELAGRLEQDEDRSQTKAGE
jgi:hypothetical protein